LISETSPAGIPEAAAPRLFGILTRLGKSTEVRRSRLARGRKLCNRAVAEAALGREAREEVQHIT
jgi:hypothetical protein